MEEEKNSLNGDEELRARIHAMSDEAISKEVKKTELDICIIESDISEAETGDLTLDSGTIIHLGADVVRIQRYQKHLAKKQFISNICKMSKNIVASKLRNKSFFKSEEKRSRQIAHF